jgi:hypothetical protein
MPADSPELKLAQHLAEPFNKPGQGHRPLSCRLLPDGGMVVISADGRKLWFTLEECNRAREELGLKTKRAPAAPPVRKEKTTIPAISSRPPGGTRDGRSEMIVLPPDLRHLEGKTDDKNRRH